jgi:uncharacterized protein
MKPFVVNVADLLFRPAARRSESLSGPTAQLIVTETIVPEGGEVTIAAILASVSDGILAEGTAHVAWTSECRRCLNPVKGETTAPFLEMYSLKPVEGDTYPITHDQVDLELVAREAILLSLPLAPLCREECAGLCLTCGADLNDGACSCVPAVADPRWAALDGLNFAGSNAQSIEPKLMKNPES